MTYDRKDGSGQSNKSDKYMVLDIEVIPKKFEESEIQEYLMDKNFPRKLHPMFSRIVMIGYKFPKGNTELLYQKDEKDLLDRFWNVLHEQKPNSVVTFNGYNFDIPFIRIRSIINGIKPTMELNLNKWKSENSNHFDCMQVLSANQTFLNVALDTSCRVFDIQIPEHRQYGEAVPKLYKAGDIDAIKEHCRQDIVMTEQLYLKLRR